MTQAAAPQLTSGADEPVEDLQRMSLIEHLDELRIRLVRSLLALIVGFLVCWGFREQIYEILRQPIDPYLIDAEGNPGKLAYFSITGPFFFYMKMCFLAAAFLVSPYIMGEVWGFVSPGLYRRERFMAIPFIFFGTFFFIGGGLFAYYVAFPYAADFLLGMGQEFQQVLDVERYFRFLMVMLLGLGVMFELPVMIFMLSQLGIVTPGFLLKHFRWAILIIYVVAAVVTPTPDIATLSAFALPTIALYFLGVFAAWIAQRSRRKRAAEEA